MAIKKQGDGKILGPVKDAASWNDAEPQPVEKPEEKKVEEDDEQ